ncbi:MAG: DUF2332 domain-containing protein [Roseiarcus sp.]
MNPAARDNFRQQAEWCERLGSPFTARVCRALHRHLTESSAFGATLLNWPGPPKADAVALRACGALNALAREGHPALAPLYPPHRLPLEDEFWLGAQAAIASEDRRLTDSLKSAPQTNEVARSAALLPGCLEIARRTGLPLALREIGASAGLNLLLDRYRYQYGRFAWGGRDAEVTIACEWRGPAYDFGDAIEVADRRGCDLNPIDATDPASRARMLSYIWPDQDARVARAEAALKLAAREGVRIEAVDAARYAARQLRRGAPGRASVLVHSIVWQYLAEATRAGIGRAVARAAAEATAQAPFAWLRMEAEAGEPRGAMVRLSLWPHGPLDEPVAVADYHGRWLEWRGIA